MDFPTHDEKQTPPKRQRLMDRGHLINQPPVVPYFLYNTPPIHCGYFNPPLPFPVVRLRGLPFDCTELEVVRFFRGLDIVDVLFVHRSDKFTGEAFCIFGYPFQVDLALQKHRQNIGRRFVEVYRSKRQEYYRAIANEVSKSCPGSPRKSLPRAKIHDAGNQSVEHTGVMRLRGLPFSAGKEDIAEFFEAFDLCEDRIHICVNSEGRPSGEAYVEFRSSEDSKAAMFKDRSTIGSRYIELFPSSQQELEEAFSRIR